VGVKITTKIKFGAIYSKQELTDANIDPIYYENDDFTVSISRIDDTNNYVLWASDSFIEITNGYNYQQQIRPICKLYKTEEVLGFIKEINNFVTETKLPQKTPEALIIAEFN